MTRLADALERAGARTIQRRTLALPKPEPRATAVEAREAVEAPAPPVPVTLAAAGPAQIKLASAAPALGNLVRLPVGADDPEMDLRTNPALVGKLVGTAGVPPPCVEQYRKLAATLHHLQLERNARVLMISSAVPAEGKTLTAANLSLTMSESYGRRVLLIDADLRRPTLHQLFDLPNLSGLGDGLRSEDERLLPLVQVSSKLTVLPAGRPDPDPMVGLTSARMRRILTEAAAVYDWVIVDTPPIGVLTDGRLLADMVDAALLVIRAGTSPFNLITRAVEALGRDRIAGVVLNGLSPRDQQANGYYGYWYGYYGGSGSSSGDGRDHRRRNR
jgi:receptor protein-tyrosine kinase